MLSQSLMANDSINLSMQGSLHKYPKRINLIPHQWLFFFSYNTKYTFREKNWVVCFLIVEFWEFFVYFGLQSYKTWHESSASITSHSVACLLVFLILSFTEFLNLMKSTLSIISFMECTFGVVSNKSLIHKNF